MNKHHTPLTWAYKHREKHTPRNESQEGKLVAILPSPQKIQVAARKKKRESELKGQKRRKWKNITNLPGFLNPTWHPDYIFPIKSRNLPWESKKPPNEERTNPNCTNQMRSMQWDAMKQKTCKSKNNKK